MANGALRLFVLATGITPMMALPANSLRNYLLIQNVGTVPITIGFDMSVTPTTGIVLAPMGSTSPGQGGALLFQSDLIPSNAIWAVSQTESTVAIFEG